MSKIIGFTLPQINDGEANNFTLPYNIAMLSALVKHKDPNIQTFYSNDIEVLIEADEVWCSGQTEAWDTVNHIGKQVLDKGKKFRVGGQHVTALPQTLRYGEAFCGPYEHKLSLEILPDWDVFGPSADMRQAVIMSSYGCPFVCKFCSSRAFWKKYFPKPADKVVAECKQLAEKGVQHIFIFDDLFTIDKRRLHEICDILYAEGLDYLTFNCLARSDSITTEVIELMHKLHIKGCGMGIESGSDSILQAMNKKNTVKQNQIAIDVLAKEGFHMGAGCVIGFPGESAKTLNDTSEFIEKNKSKVFFELYPCVPLPGTWLWQYFIQKNNIDYSTFDWSALKIRANCAEWEKYHLLSDTCTKEDLQNICLRHTMR